MTDAMGLLAGCLLVFLVCTWAVWHFATAVRTNFQTRTAIDMTLSEVDQSKAPRMFWWQIFGYSLVAICVALIGIAAIVTFVGRLAGG